MLDYIFQHSQGNMAISLFLYLFLNYVVDSEKRFLEQLREVSGEYESAERNVVGRPYIVA